jgi:hypothetical protein
MVRAGRAVLTQEISMSITQKRIALSACFSLLAFGAAAEKVGSVGAVNQTARGAAPGATAQVLSLGSGIVDRERVETSGDGNAQIVFLDSSTLTIGRNTAVTIDRFVYSGAAGSGQQAISAAKGVLRFVGGGVSHGGGASLTTPAATIGVRGGTALVSLEEPNCGTLIADQYGELTIVAGGRRIVLRRPGVAVCVALDGLSEPFRISAEQIARLNATLGSSGGQHGGAKRRPTNQEASNALGDERPPADLVARNGGLDYLGAFWGGDELARSRAQSLHQPLPPVEEYDYTPPGSLL